MENSIARFIADGGTGISLTISAADLRKVVAEIIKGEFADLSKKSKSDEPLLTRAEVAEKLDVTPVTLSRWSKLKYLVPVKVGRKCFYRQSDIERLVNAKTK